MRKTVLFICVGNSGRSQMAEAFFKQASNKKWNAKSAGIKPDRLIHPLTIETMKEVGIDLSQKKPKKLTKKMLEEAQRIIAMDSIVMKKIPTQYRLKTENWKINSLLGAKKESVEQVREEIRKSVLMLTQKLDSEE